MGKKSKKKERKNPSPSWLLATIIMLLGVIVCYGVSKIAPDGLDSDISMIVGLLSIGIGLYALYQSYIYNSQSDRLYDKMMSQLDTIEDSQDELGVTLEEMIQQINSDPRLTTEEKIIAVDAVDEFSMKLYSALKLPIQKLNRETVEMQVKDKIEKYYTLRHATVTELNSEYAKLKIEYDQYNIYVIYSIRAGLSVTNWPEKSQQEFFSSRYTTFWKNMSEKDKKSICLVLMVYADSVFYCLCDDKLKNITGCVVPKKDDLLKDNRWISEIQNEIKKYVKNNVS